MVPPAWRDHHGDDTFNGDDAVGGVERMRRLVRVDAATSTSTSSSDSSYRKNSRTRLKPSDKRRFRGDDTFDRVARAVCDAGCLPRKELYETWEAALIITRAFGHRLGALRVLDMAAGHGLLAHLLLILNPRCRSAVCVDRRQPHSFDRLSASLAGEWPHIIGRIRFVRARVEGAVPSPDTLLVSVHACGGLTDLVLKMAVDGSAPVAVVPCCHARDAEWDALLEDDVQQEEEGGGGGGGGGVGGGLRRRLGGVSMPFAMVGKRWFFGERGVRGNKPPARGGHTRHTRTEHTVYALL